MEELIAASIRSLEELEVLLALRVLRQCSTASQLSASLQIPDGLVQAALENLVTSRLCARYAGRSASVYEYAPETDDLRLVVEELVRACEAHRVEVIMLISSKAIERVRSGVLQMFVDGPHGTAPKRRH